MSQDQSTPSSLIDAESREGDATEAHTSQREVLVPSASSRRELPVSGSIFDTSEIELLISGAFLFSLIKILDLLRGGIEYFSIHFPDGEVYRLFFAYLLMADMGLILALAGHLGLRGFWIGLLGLHSVFPEPTDYDKLNYGPLYIRHMKERWADIPALIGRTDRMASLVFSFSMTFVLMGLYFAAVIGVFGGIWFLIEQKHPDALAGVPSPLFIIFAFLALHLVAMGLDRLFRGRAPEDVPTPVQWIGRLAFPMVDRTLLGGLTGPIMSKFRAHLRGPRFLALLAAYMVVLMAAIFGSLIAGSDELSRHAYSFFPEESSQTIVDGYYADRKGSRGIRNPKPRIQSDVIEGPYVKLFLPYSPRLDKNMRQRCPEVVEALAPRPDDVSDGENPEDTYSRDDAAASDAVVCVAGHYRVSLDGSPIENLDLIFSREQEKGRRGLTAYIPVAELRPGRHNLLIEEVDHPLRDDDDEQERHHIPFWI